MRAINARHSFFGVGAASVGCLGLLVHCGGGNGPGPSESDASSEATPDTGGQTEDSGGDADNTRDAGSDADATLDAGTGADGTVDADAAPPDAGTVGDGGSDAADAVAADADAGPPEAGPVPCDVDAQADAQTCLGPATMACCNGFCADTAADPRNCGHCGNGCTDTQFCTGVQCDDAILANICGNPKATVVLDIFPTDNEAGAVIGAALVANCVPPTTVVALNQDAGGVLDPTTGRPITGVGNTSINGGGSYAQQGLHYLEDAGLTPLYWNLTGQNYDIIDRATGTNVVATTPADVNANHDYFYVQLAVEPQSGTLCFSGVGLGGYGTQAASYYLSAVIIPNRATYTKAWYVYEWTDTNNDSIGNAGDTFALVASAP